MSERIIHLSRWMESSLLGMSFDDQFTLLYEGFQIIPKTSLLSYIDYLEIWNFACSKFRYDTLQKQITKAWSDCADVQAGLCVCC